MWSSKVADYYGDLFSFSKARAVPGPSFSSTLGIPRGVSICVLSLSARWGRRMQSLYGDAMVGPAVKLHVRSAIKEVLNGSEVIG